jgi:two-component system, cell cycle response regulator DivK
MGRGMKRILIIEDNEKNMKLVRDILQAKGFETMEAVSAEEGLALVKLHRFDLVLMDIQLPGMNGIEALECLRADEETNKIPVVAVTASVTIQDQSQITRAGFDAFISKPISVKEFLETVNAIVGKPT